MPKKPSKKNDSPLEIAEQKTIAEYLRLKGLTFSAITQDTYTKSWSQKMRNKTLGVNPGVPDMIVILPNLLLFIEVKRRKASYPTTAQKDWIEKLEEIPNVKAMISRGSDEAIDFMESYLKNGN